MLSRINDQELHRSASALRGAAADVHALGFSVGRLLLSANLPTDDAQVRIQLGAAHSRLESLAGDHRARAALAGALEAFDWTQALLSGRLPKPAGAPNPAPRPGGEQPTLVGTAGPPYRAPTIFTSAEYDPYYQLIPAGADVLAAAGDPDTCAADHFGSGGLIGPDGRTYPIAYPEFLLDNGDRAHIGPGGRAIGGNWRTVAMATGVHAGPPENTGLSVLAGAVTMRTPTAMPINPDDYAVLHVDHDGAAWVSAAPTVPDYGLADIPEYVELEAPGVPQQPPSTGATLIDGASLVIGSISAGIANADYERNRATRAYVVLFEESGDGRLRSRFIEHQVWVLDDSSMQVRSAGVSVTDGGIVRTGLVSAPIESGDPISLAVPDPNLPRPNQP